MRIFILMLGCRGYLTYPVANLTIPLLMTSFTAQIPCTVYWRSRKIMKHCLPFETQNVEILMTKISNCKFLISLQNIQQEPLQNSTIQNYSRHQ